MLLIVACVIAWTCTPSCIGPEHLIAFDLHTQLHSHCTAVAPLAHVGCPSELTKIIELLEAHCAELVGVVVKSRYNWYWLVNSLKAVGFDVRLANAVAMRRDDGLEHSDDKDDAAFLAHLARLRIFPTGYSQPPQERELRGFSGACHRQEGARGVTIAYLHYLIHIERKFRTEKTKTDHI